MTAEPYGERIRSERLRLKMTQSAFAKGVDISQGSQVGYESGAHLPNVQYLARAAAIGVDIVFVILGQRGTSAAIDMVDWDTHDRIAAAVERWLDEHSVTLSVEKKMRLVRLFLSKYTSIDEVDDEYISETLALVA